MWKSHLATLLNSWKNCEIGNFVKQNINSQENFEVIDDLCATCHKIKSQLHKLTLNRAAGKGGIFAEHVLLC